MSVDYGYDVDQHVVNEGLAPGIYKVICTKEEFIDTKTGDSALAAIFEVTEGADTGKDIRNLYNLFNSGANAVKVQNIAKDQLKRTFEAMGRLQKDGLQGGQLIIHVKQNGQYTNIDKMEALDAPGAAVAATAKESDVPF